MDKSEEQLAKALGWFSIGLGLADLLAPREVARLIGIPEEDKNLSLLRGIGFREIVSGVGILTTERPTGWVWSRVAGDAMDIALLSGALSSPRAERNRVTTATASVIGVALLDLFNGMQLSGGDGGAHPHANGRPPRTGAIQVRKSITISGTPEQLYGFWRDFRNLPRFMRHLESVDVSADGRSHWKAKGPAGSSVEWDAEITEDRPNERIAWRSVGGSDVPNSGSVEFVPATGGRGTVVRVEMEYQPPGGPIGSVVAKLFGEEPNQQVYDDLRAFKQVIEVGEVVLSSATLSGARLLQPPAQPPAGAGQR